MERVTLPNSDIEVSSICLGTWQFNGGEQSADKTWPAQPEEVSKSIVDKAIELGINFFDTAEAYLNSEKVLGRILEGRRKDVVVATKFLRGGVNFTPEEIEKSLANSLTNLKTDYIDLYQMHWPSCTDDLGACLEELKRQKAKGTIRAYGVCNFGPQNIQTAVDVGAKLSTNQLSYSLLWRPIEYEIMPCCERNNIGILPYSPLQQGLLTGKYLKLDDVPEGRRRTRLFNSTSTSLSKHGQDGCEKQMFQAIADIKLACENAGVPMSQAALSWCMQQPSVKSVIVGARTPEQVAENVNTVQLKQSLVDELTKATEELKNTVGNNVDLWAAESRMA